MSTDQFLFKRYNDRSYHCLHFTRDVWLHLTGVDITDILYGLLGSIIEVKKSHFRSFKRLHRPVDTCLVYMKQAGTVPHVGVHISGKVIHIKSSGVQSVPLEVATAGFRTVRYYS